MPLPDAYPHADRRLLLAIAVLASLVTPAIAGAPPAPPAEAVGAQIRELIGSPSSHDVAGEPIASTDIRTIYAAFADRPLWYGDAAADARREVLVASLGAAATHGIAADGLHLKALGVLVGGASVRQAAERDVLLTDALLRYADELRRGAVGAAALGPDWHITQDPFLATAAVIDALRYGPLSEFLNALPPSDPRYQALRAALERYRTIVGRGGWAPIPGRDEVKLDGRDPRLVAVRDRLIAEGDVPSSARDAAPGQIATAVRLFQARNGLEVDGRVGRRTLAALNVRAEARLEQIAANLERWRHLPRQLGPRHVEVNLADASLDLIENGAASLHTRVIVGDVRHQSPDIKATITGVTFNPPWNVPPSIAVKEMLPRLKRNPAYLAANDIVIVGRDSNDPFGLRVDWRRISPRDFPFRLQQRPGLKNSLGLLKLEMPNPWDVYLHDTPVKALFQRAQRGFSHGCVRVQQPAELARRLLDDESWTPDAMAQAAAAGVTHTVALRRPVPVYLLYWTAFVDADGAVNFRADAYGRDTAVERALGLAPPSTNANQSQRVASCSHPVAGLSLQGG